MNGLALITLQIIFTALIILLLYRLKNIFGLALLFIFVGSNQYLQAILASTVYVPIWGNYMVSPGSVVIFSSSLFAILLIYLKEDVHQTRTLIYGVVLSNITLTLMTYFSASALVLKGALNLMSVPVELFNVDKQIFLIGTSVLVLDAFFIVVIYEALIFKLEKLGLFLRILITMLAVLYFDAIVFTTGNFLMSPQYKTILVSQLVGKTYSGCIYGSILYLYLVYWDHQRYLSRQTIPSRWKDIFFLFTDREEFDLLKTQIKEQELSFATERMHSQEALMRLQTAVESSGESICMVDLEGVFTYINPQFTRLFGYTPEEVIHKEKIRILIHSPKPDEVYKDYVQRLMNKEVIMDESVDRTKDGRVVVIESSTSPILNPQGELTGFLSVQRDITARKQKEKTERFFTEMKQRLSEVSMPHEVASVIMHAADELFNWDSGLINIFNESEGCLKSLYCADIIDGVRQEVDCENDRDLPTNMFYKVLHEGAQLINRTREELDADKGMIPFGDEQHRSASLMFAPISRLNRNIGFASIQSYRMNAFTTADLEIFNQLAEQCGGALERSYANAALRENEQRFRKLFEEGQVGIVMTDMQHRFMRVNSKVSEILGYADEEMCRLTFPEITHPDDLDEDLKLAERVIRGELPSCRTQKRFIRKNGETVWVSLTGSVIRNEAGDPLYGLAMMEDISEQKKRELIDRVFGEMKQHLAEASTPREMANAVMSAADELFGWDACNLEIYSEEDNRIYTIINMDTSDGKKIEYPINADGEVPGPYFKISLQKGPRLVQGDVSQYIREGKAKPFGNINRPSASRMYAPIRRQNHHIGIITIQSYTPGYYKDRDLEIFSELADQCSGALDRAYTAVERQRLQEELMRKEHLAMVGETIQGITHSMKNIFMALDGSVIFIEQAQKEQDWELMERTMPMLRSATTNLYLFLMNMLYYSKKHLPVFQPVTIEMIYEDTRKLLKVAAERAHVEMLFSIEPGAEVIFSDYQRVLQCVLNLGVNGMDAMTKGGQIWFRCKLSKASEYGEDSERMIPVIEVQDTGIGIPEESMRHIFDPFFSTKGSKGTGLGLPSVKQFMEEQEGKVMVDSIPCQGTTFRLVFLHKTE